MTDPREALVTALRRAADRCCQCTDGHHEQDPPYGTDDDVRISRDDARKIADTLAAGWTPPGERALPSVEDVARRVFATQGVDEEHALDIAHAVLALFPGRTEREVKAEAWDEGYKNGYRDRRLEASYEPGTNPYREGGA